MLAGRERWTALVTLYLLIFTDYFAKMIVLIFVAALILNPDTPFVAHATTLGTRHALYALAVAVNPAMDGITGPFIGAFSDRFGRRKILLITTLVGVAAYVIALTGIYTSSLALVIVGRGLGGSAGANVPLASAGITDLTTPQNRGRFMAIIAVMEGSAWVLGPAAGSYLADQDLVSWFGPAIPFWLLVLLFGSAYLLLQFGVREMHAPSGQGRYGLRKMITDYIAVFRLPSVLRTFLIFTTVVTGELLFVYFFALFLIERYAFSETDVANVFFYFAIWRFTGGIFCNQLFRKFTAARLAIIPMWVLGFASLAFVLLDSPVNLWWLVPLSAVAQAIILACFYTLFANEVEANMRGKIFAAWQTARSVILVSIPFVISLPTITGGLLVFGAAAWYTLTKRRLPTV